MAAAVGDQAWLRALLRFEKELAAAEAALGIIPATSATAIARAVDGAHFDLATLGADAVESATPVVPLQAVLREQLPGDAAPYLHYGATSQDAIDTAAMLLAKDALGLLVADLDALAGECAALAERHAGTVMSGRTLMQQARPTTFGLKAAGWLSGVVQARRGLRRIRESRLAVQLGGAAGSLDVLGPAGLLVAAALAERLQLTSPELPWHADRTRVGEMAGALAVAGGAAAKVALDVVLLAQTEVGEVREKKPGGSSAMPEKRNAARSVLARSAYARLLGQVSVLLAGLAGEHERAAGAWQAEWPALTEAFRLSAGVAARTRESLSDLWVDVERMRRNAGDAAAPAAARELVARALNAYRREAEGT